MATAPYQVLYVTLVFAVSLATSDVNVSTVDMTTVATTTTAATQSLTLVMLTPLDGNLGFERNAAASTRALRQAQADGLLSGINVT